MDCRQVADSHKRFHQSHHWYIPILVFQDDREVGWNLTVMTLTTTPIRQWLRPWFWLLVLDVTFEGFLWWDQLDSEATNLPSRPLHIPMSTVLIPFLSNATHSRSRCIPGAQDVGDYYFSDCLWDRDYTLWKLLSSPVEETGHIFQSHAAFPAHLCYIYAPP